MTRTQHDYDEDDADYDEDDADDDDEAGSHIDPEGPDPSEMDSSDDPDLEICPHCRKLISEDAERCPHCGQYISAEDEPLSKRAWVVIVLILVTTLTGMLWIF